MEDSVTVPKLLTPFDHSRDSAGMVYVYPVVSRRAGGISIGVNLNPNNACNWRCIYCQVPNLTRGTAPEIDLAKLEHELRSFLQKVVFGDFMQENVPVEARRLNDIALSGNGEPTSAREFTQVIEIISKLMAEFELVGKIKLVLITNGSLLHRENVQDGLRLMANVNGEVWFKLDRAAAQGIRKTNGTKSSPVKVFERLRTSITLCPTWLQTCMFMLDGESPSIQEQQAYLDFIAHVRREKLALKGVLLYGLARPSMQVEAPRLAALPQEWMEIFAEKIRKLGIECHLNV